LTSPEPESSFPAANRVSRRQIDLSETKIEFPGAKSSFRALNRVSQRSGSSNPRQLVWIHHDVEVPDLPVLHTQGDDVRQASLEGRISWVLFWGLITSSSMSGAETIQERGM
jgi:hypothetical protein